MTYKNFTPHTINLNNGDNFPSEGIARVSASFSSFDMNNICNQYFGEVEGLPESRNGVFIIVSAMVLSASKNRYDLVAPATGHKDCVRNEKGHIVSVPGFVGNDFAREFALVSDWLVRNPWCKISANDVVGDFIEVRNYYDNIEEYLQSEEYYRGIFEK